MPSKPTSYPRWEGTTTEPTEPKKTAGFSGSEKPAAEHFNWLFNLIYTWLLFLAESLFAWTDVFWPMVSKVVSLPTTGGGTLTRTSPEGYALFVDSGGFCRRVYTGAATAKTYTASRDTYVDLHQDGTLTYVDVVNGGGEPAVTANSYRIAKVVTNATEVTAATWVGKRYIQTDLDIYCQDVVCNDISADVIGASEVSTGPLLANSATVSGDISADNVTATGTVEAGGLTIGADANPVAATGLRNVACGKNTAKAWGWVATSGGAINTQEGVNYTVTFTNDGAGDYFTVTFGEAMDNFYYGVDVCILEHGAAYGILPEVPLASKNATDFRIYFRDAVAWTRNTAVNTFNISFSFRVFGEQT